jgi:hypothetical protein
MTSKLLAIGALISAVLFLACQWHLRGRAHPFQARPAIADTWFLLSILVLFAIAGVCAWTVAAGARQTWFWVTLGADSAVMGVAVAILWHRTRLARGH